MNEGASTSAGALDSTFASSGAWNSSGVALAGHGRIKSSARSVVMILKLNHLAG